MPKPKTPATETPAPAEPTVDYSQLIDALAKPLTTVSEAETKSKSGILDAVIVIREFREENPTADRGDVKAAIQQAVATMLSIKISKVQNTAANGGDAYANSLSSSMLSAAWPKGEAEEKRVQKAIAAGKGWVEIKKAASKPQSRPARDPDANKITKEKFPTALNLFLTRAQTDMAIDLPTVLDMAESAIEAIRNAPPANA